jgi:hypothetical protein
MASAIDEAMRRLESSLGLLEVAVMRRLEAEKRKGDLETELQIMQDDRARLALELDGMLARLQRAEAAAADVSERVKRASAAIEDVLAETGDGERE